MNAKKRGRKILALVMIVCIGSILCLPIIGLAFMFYEGNEMVNLGGNIKATLTMLVSYLVLATIGVFIFGARAGVKILMDKKSPYWTSFWSVLFTWSVMSLGAVIGSAILWRNGETVLWQQVGLIIGYILATAIVVALVVAFPMARVFVRSMSSESLDSALID